MPACLFALVHTASAQFAYESAEEFFASGDLDGDGRRDVVVVDKVSGTYRAAYQLAADTFTWANPRASGVDDVTGFGLGKLFATTRDGLVFTAPAANRLNLFDANSATIAPLPVPAFVPSTRSLFQDFETSTAQDYVLTTVVTGPGAAIQNPGSGSTGRSLRLTYDTINSQINTIAFRQTAPGLFPTIQAEFDFRSTSVGQAADGFSFMLIPTATYGASGPGFTGFVGVERPNVAGVFGIGFDVYANNATESGNDISAHWNGVQYTNAGVAPSVVLTASVFHRARITLQQVGGGSRVTVAITPNINSSPGATFTAISNLFISTLNPYDCRVEFAGRCGALDTSIDLDNVQVQFLTGPTENLSLGPNLAIAVDFAGAGNTPLDDLFAGTLWNSAPTSNQLAVIRNATPPTFSPLAALDADAPTARGNAVTLKTGTAPMAGMVFRGASGDYFRAYSSGLPVQAAIVASNLPPAADYVFANFTGGALAQFLFYQPGGSDLRLFPVEEFAANQFRFGPSNAFNLGAPIRQVITLPAGASTKLLVLFDDCATARVYSFNGVNPPASIQQFTAEAGECFTGGGALGGDKFVMLSGRGGSQTTTHFQNHSWNGSSYVPGQGGALPALSALGQRANVFLFQGEPFVVARAALLRSVNAGDWTSRLTGIPGALGVTAETFRDASTGLGNATATPVGSTPPGANAGLVNQYTNNISLFAYTAAEGDTIVDVSISPPSGTYPTSIVARLTSSNPSNSLYYRLGDGSSWTRYSEGTPLRVFSNTTVFYYGQAAFGSAKSRIKAALYQFTKPPGSLDSDGDGVPDYVELAQGTDPNKSDTDGDGHTDFSELLGGTNPRTAQTNQPASLALGTGYGVVFGLKPVDGSGSINVSPGLGVNAYGRLIGGGLLDQSVTAIPPGGSNPVVRLNNLAVTPGQRWLVLHTDPNFAVQTPAPDKNVGRELIGLLAVPETSSTLPQAYEYSGGNINDEAKAWIIATSNALLAAAAPVLTTDVGVADTLAALLVEQRVGEILTDRGDSRGSNVTLFPFRAADAGRTTLSDSDLLALESSPTNTQPAFSTRAMLDVLSDSLNNPVDSAAESVRQLGLAVYRLSARSNNAAPGVYPSPVDALREFVRAGTLHSNYFSGLMLSAGDLNDEQQAVRNLLNRVTPRPSVSRTLEVRADTFDGPCTVLDRVGAGTQVSLFHAGGLPYNLLNGFRLAPGTRVEVTGYTDISGSSCPGEAIEVTALSFLSAPAVSSTDADGDLMADAWEAVFAVTDPNADTDNDGATNLAEFLAGTDPRDPNSRPAGASPSPVFAPPLVNIEKLADGNVRLSWSLPLEAVGRVQFRILASPEIGAPFTDTGLEASQNNGRFEVLAPVHGRPAHFYRVTMSVR